MTEIKIIVAATISAIFGSVVVFFRKNGVKSYSRLAVEMLTSMLVGGVAGSLLLHFTDWPPYVTCAICAALGTMSANVLAAWQSTFQVGATAINNSIKNKFGDKGE